MDQETQSLIAITEFMEHHDLKDEYGNTTFPSLTSIDLNGNVKMHTTEVRIVMGGYEAGTVTLVDVDPNVYPMHFLAKFQECQFPDDNNLVIKGKHPRHGKYTVTIQPS